MIGSRRLAGKATLGGAAVMLWLCASCSSNDHNPSPAGGTTPPAVQQPASQVMTDSTGESTQSVEWVSYHSVLTFSPTDLIAMATGLFGADAQNGKFLTNKEIAPSVYLSSAADPTTPEQAIVTLNIVDQKNANRQLAVVPASFAVGTLYVQTLQVALAAVEADAKQSANSGDNILLQYQVTSPQGGTFSFGVQAINSTYTLVLDVSSPTTSLTPGSVGAAATSNTPYDLINGTVWFGLSQDDFDYFASHAYGADNTAAQNFNDFPLVPYNWLRLTVTPHLDQQYVDVSFAVAPSGTSGPRVPLAKAPASVLAGGTFQALVDRAVSTMNAQEAAKPGSSTPWTVPFYYNDPAGGGVVQVVAQGQAGQFQIAYAVLSPRHTLTDVQFNPYNPVTIAPPSPSATAGCAQLGNAGIVPASEGAFDITFSASSVVTSSPDLKGPLKGTIYCSLYNASDVTVTGPNPGAKSLEDFQVVNADLSVSKAPTYLTQVHPKGTYQVLCFQDLHGDGNPDMGDPVTLPIGSYPLACNLNPIAVQFALLDPEGESP
jgi:hypothetical protein